MDDFRVEEIPAENIEQNPDILPEKQARSKFNRCGLSVLILYAAMSVVTSIVSAIIIGIRTFLITVGALIDQVQFNSVNDIFSFLSESDLALYIYVASPIGAGVGMIVGTAFMKKILGYKECAKIEKKSVSFGGFLLLVLMAFGLWGIGAALGNYTVFFGNSGGQQLFPGFFIEVDGKAMLPYYCYAIFGAPIVEELAFRKTMLTVLRPYGEVGSAFVTALLFGMIHGNSGQFLLAFFLGILLATVFLKTGKVIYTILLHAIINFTATLPDILSVFGIDIAIPWNFAVLALTVSGLLAMVLARKWKFLALQKTDIPNANAFMFKNPGMRIVKILGLITLISTDVATMISSAVSMKSPLPLLVIFSTAASVLCILFVYGKVGKSKPAPGPDSHTEEPSV